jgi:hypothetical protein
VLRCFPSGFVTRSVFLERARLSHSMLLAMQVKSPLKVRYPMENRSCGILARTALYSVPVASKRPEPNESVVDEEVPQEPMPPSSLFDDIRSIDPVIIMREELR